MVEREIGSYQLLRRIGAGGMGEVWLAQHVALGRRAAIKLLHAEMTRRPELVARFFNEARATTAISDPGIVQVFDFGHASDGCAYIVMELLEGETLEARVRRLGVLAIPDALRLVRQVAGTLACAHALGIIHRDLKPENIFIVRDPEVPGGERAKVLDFGIAKLADGGTLRTQTEAFMGTPTYMSPEQCRGAGRVDARSDVYALGCVLFALVTGRPPFEGDGMGEIVAMHLREPAPRASSRNPSIPSVLDDLIARCLAKDPNERFSSAGELADALRRVQPSWPPAGVAPTIPPTVPPRATQPTTLSTGAAEAVAPAPARRRGLLWAIAGTALVGAVIAALVLRPSGEAAPVDAPPAASAVAAAPDAAPAALVDAAIASAPPIDAAIASAPPIDAAIASAPPIDAPKKAIDAAPPKRLPPPSTPQVPSTTKPPCNPLEEICS